MASEQSPKKRLLAGLLVLSAGIEAIQTKRLELERTVVKSVPIDTELQVLRDAQNDLHNIVAELPDEAETVTEVFSAAPPITAPATPASTPAPLRPTPQPAPSPAVTATPTPAGKSGDSPVDLRSGGRSG